MTKKRAKTRESLGRNIDKMIDSGALDARAAARLRPSVKAKIERLSNEKLQVVIDFYNDVGKGGARPKADGSIF
jgi:hypothetical protein